MINNQLDQLLSEQKKYKALLNNFINADEPLMNEIMDTAIKSYDLGEINFYQFVTSYETAVQIDLKHIDNVLQYNKTTSEINYFSK